MRTHGPDAGISVTTPIDVTFGEFNLSNFRLPYMTAVLTMQEAAQYLNLVKDDPTYASRDWKIEELYQRDVDHFRVRDIADKYLVKESRRPQFFNALTVVIRPKESVGSDYQAPAPADRYPETRRVGPVRIDFQKKDPVDGRPRGGTFGILRWNVAEVWATAIDGQHRLAAIQEIAKDDPERLHTSQVAVIFILIDEKVGFSAPEGWDELKTMRSVFIDLNRRAVPVTRARNLLLDDLDPTAEFVRQLIAPRLQFKGSGRVNRAGLPIGDQREFVDRLPLELVDWHGESKAKVERGPYVTSILALDWIVRRILKEEKIEVPERFDLDNVEDDKEYVEIKKVLKEWPEAWQSGIKEAWEEAKNSRTLFHLNHHHVKSLGAEFSRKWGPPITRLLTLPNPYRRLVDKRLSTDTLSPEFGQWYQAKAARDRNERSRYSEHFERELDKVRKELSQEGINVSEFETIVNDIERDIKGDSILFYLVGQRALTQTFIDLAATDEGPLWANDAGIDLAPFENCIRDFYAHYIVTAFNRIDHASQTMDRLIFSRNALTERREATQDLPQAFWAGALVKRDAPDQMDFSQNAAIRGAKWLRFIVHLHWFCQTNKPTKEEVVNLWGDLLLRHDPTGLSSMTFGPPLTDSIRMVVGSERSTVYRHPVPYLLHVLEEEARTHDKLVAAALQRMEYVLEISLEAVKH